MRVLARVLKEFLQCFPPLLSAFDGAINAHVFNELCSKALLSLQT